MAKELLMLYAFCWVNVHGHIGRVTASNLSWSRVWLTSAMIYGLWHKSRWVSMLARPQVLVLLSKRRGRRSSFIRHWEPHHLISPSKAPRDPSSVFVPPPALLRLLEERGVPTDGCSMSAEPSPLPGGLLPAAEDALLLLDRDRLRALAAAAAAAAGSKTLNPGAGTAAGSPAPPGWPVADGFPELS